MAEVTWTAEAQQWLESIFEHIAEDNPQAAARTVQAIYGRAQDLIGALAASLPLGARSTRSFSRLISHFDARNE